jgi:PKD domain
MGWVARVALVGVAAVFSWFPAGALAASGFVADEPLSGADALKPVLAFAPNGYAVAAWGELAQERRRVFVSVRAPGQSWSGPRELWVSPQAGMFGHGVANLSAAVNNVGDVAVAWETQSLFSAGEVSVVTRPAGAGFGQAQTLPGGGWSPRQNFPVVGIDAGGEVTLLTGSAPMGGNPDDDPPAVEERVFEVGGSLLAADVHLLRTGCLAARPVLAVAVDGDAVAGMYCQGAVFGVREGGVWTFAPPLGDTTGGACPDPDPSVTQRPLDVAIDSQGRPVGLLASEATTSPCEESDDWHYAAQYRLVLPVEGVMTPVEGPPFLTGTATTHQLDDVIDPVLGLSNDETFVAWGAKTGGGPTEYVYQPRVQRFDLAGAAQGLPQTLGDEPSGAFVRPALAIAPDGQALVAWARGGGVMATLAPAEGDQFDLPLTVSSGTSADEVRAVLNDDGDGAVGFLQGPPGGTRLHVRGYDATPPKLDGIALPAQAFAGQPATLTATAYDFWGPLTASWDFGDGSNGNGGVTASHAFPAAGEYPLAVSVSDALGNTESVTAALSVAHAPPVEPPITSPPTAPVSSPRVPELSRVSISPKRFRVAPPLAGKRRRLPTSTTIAFTLDTAAKVDIAIDRALPGRRVGKSCVKPTRSRHTRSSCTRYREVGRLTRQGMPGQNTPLFSGRLKSTALRPGRYRATLVAWTTAGRSRPITRTFHIAR